MVRGFPDVVDAIDENAIIQYISCMIVEQK
jgi:hypothetical protein